MQRVLLRPAHGDDGIHDGGQGPLSRSNAALGWVAALLLAVSLLLPYWRARLFAPQYRNGLTATLYAFGAAGDVGEIDNLNHYVGVPKLANLAKIEKKLAIPGVLILCVFCVLIPRTKNNLLKGSMLASVALYPAIFAADLKFWFDYASTHLDPTAALKLKPFSIPLIGVGKVGQFASHVYPMPGFYLSVLAPILLIAGQIISRKSIAAAALALCVLFSASPSLRAQDLQDMIDGSLPGAVIILPARTFHGPVTLNKPLTLMGAGQAVIDGSGSGTIVTVSSPQVTLDSVIIRDSGDSLLMEDSAVRVESASVTVKNCRIENVLFGVFLVHASNALVQDNFIRGKDIDISRRGDLIRGWYSDRAQIIRNRLEQGRDAVLWFSTGSIVEGNTVLDARYGLHFMYTHNARVTGNLFSGNSVGAYLMYSQDVIIENNRFENNRGPSGIGLGLKESDSVAVTKNVFHGNRQGIFIDQSPLIEENTNRFMKNHVAYNDIGVAIMPGAKGDIFTENSFQDNLEQVSVRGGGQLSRVLWHENGMGNFWSDYAGYGAAGASVGKIPYKIESLFENMADRFPLARFFLFTPASQAIELANKAFPLFLSKPKITDPFPLLKMPENLLPLEDPSKKIPIPETAGLVLAALGLFAVISSGSKTGKGTEEKIPSPAVHSITARQVGKSFSGRAILSGFDLSVSAGECVVLWGANGAGKSTFLKCLLGLMDFEGAVEIFGRDVRAQGKKARKFIGYLPQELTGYDWTVRQTLEFVCQVRQVDFSAIPPILEDCLLAGEEDKKVPALSGGMKQKLALALALIADPAVLVLDEPCSNLDLKSRREFLEVLKGLKGTRTLLVTSHRLDEVLALADRVVVMEEGLPVRELEHVEDVRLEDLA